jgi:putative hydrolase of the HAD superfamily
LSIKAVVFDYGQVISLPQDPTVIDRIADLAGVERANFASALWNSRSDYDRGIINAREYYRRILSKLSVKADADYKLIDKMIKMDLESWKNINGETVALMEDVKNAGYILGILSNMPNDFLAWARENLPVFSLPQVGLFSCEVNLLKPEKAIYRKLLSMLSAKGVASGGEVVFFDDMGENIKGAESLGINAFLWKDPESARRELLSLGVAV